MFPLEPKSWRRPAYGYSTYIFCIFISCHLCPTQIFIRGGPHAWMGRQIGELVPASPTRSYARPLRLRVGRPAALPASARAAHCSTPWAIMRSAAGFRTAPPGATRSSTRPFSEPSLARAPRIGGPQRQTPRWHGGRALQRAQAPRMKRDVSSPRCSRYCCCCCCF